MPVVPSIVNLLKAGRIKEIDHFRKHSWEVQEKTFFNLVETASLTEYGRTFDFKNIRNVREFQSRVPVISYEDLIPWVERIGNGEPDLLWPGKIKWFAKSSGTTSAKSKFIPLTGDALQKCHYKAMKDVLAIYFLNNPSTKIFSGKALTLGGSHRIDKFSSRAMYGDLSAILLENAPMWSEFLKTPSKKIALTEDFEKKLELIAKTSSKQNVTSFSGVPSWNLTLIKYILNYTGKSDLLDVWPNLEVFFHGGICFNPYREIYRKLIDSDKMHYMETYNASEGFFGIQDVPSDSDMLLMLDYGIFYEFIPAEMAGNPSALSCPITDVEPGVNYAIVVSTNTGLWRYMIGDTIVFTGKDPYKFHISGRTRHFINAFGEEVIIDNANKALAEACKITGAIVNEFTAGPVFMGEASRGSHEWLIEFEKEPDDLDKFTEVLDITLQSVNSDYEAKRFRDINLIKPVVRAVPPGTFSLWLKSKNKLGGQNKVPRLFNTREYIEEINRIIGL